MPRIQRTLLVLAHLVAFTAIARAAEPANLTLEQALGTAEGVNLTVLLGREASAQAMEASAQARVGILPSVSALAAQRRTDSVAISGGRALSAS
jgi:hypothetical protein